MYSKIDAKILTIDDSPIVTLESILRQKSVETTIEHVQEINLIGKLQEASEKAWCDGCGLAAIQIGVPLRMAWYRIPKVEKGKIVPGTGQSVTMINPKIITQNLYQPFHGEGCLSIPDKRFNTGRYSEIIVEGIFIVDGDTGDGEVKRFSLSGFEAVLVQHEIDHLDGILCKDKEREFKKISVPGRNDKCPCGSGYKYKKCCMEQDQAKK